MNSKTFLLLNLALGLYNVGTIWAHEVDIFRSWRLVDPKDFLQIQTVHWHKLPYWVFIPVGLGLAGRPFKGSAGLEKPLSRQDLRDALGSNAPDQPECADPSHLDSSIALSG